jgi:lipopolysaccharide/colanic/teichoic acid biosynthesis glycosyltransferase
MKRTQALISHTRSIPLVIKRCMDLLLSLAGLLFLTPLFFLLATLIHLESHGPAIFYQARIGRGGRQFQMLKFRTMYMGSGWDFIQHLENNSIQKVSYDRFQKLVNDPRLTPLGRFLRRFSLDELPQLWNVLRGEMSLVGPRPFLPEQLDFYGPTYAKYVLARPGMTGLWQVSGRNLLSFAERVRLDEIYLYSWSLKLDICILWRTVGVVLHQDGAY